MDDTKVLSKALSKLSIARTDRRTFNSSCFSSSCCRVCHQTTATLITLMALLSHARFKCNHLRNSSQQHRSFKHHQRHKTLFPPPPQPPPLLPFLKSPERRFAPRRAVGRTRMGRGEERGISRACNTSLFFFPFFLFFVRPPDRACSLEDGEKGEGEEGILAPPIQFSSVQATAREGGIACEGEGRGGEGGAPGS